MKYFWDPPPKKRPRDKNGRDMATRTSVCLYQQPVTWIFIMSRLSNPFIEKHYSIIVVFHAHISACMIFFIQNKTHEVST